MQSKFSIKIDLNDFGHKSNLEIELQNIGITLKPYSN
jgi:hypothetical protein